MSSCDISSVGPTEMTMIRFPPNFILFAECLASVRSWPSVGQCKTWGLRTQDSTKAVGALTFELARGCGLKAIS